MVTALPLLPNTVSKTEEGKESEAEKPVGINVRRNWVIVEGGGGADAGTRHRERSKRLNLIAVTVRGTRQRNPFQLVVEALRLLLVPLTLADVTPPNGHRRFQETQLKAATWLFLFLLLGLLVLLLALAPLPTPPRRHSNHVPRFLREKKGFCAMICELSIEEPEKGDTPGGGGGGGWIRTRKRIEN